MAGTARQPSRIGHLPVDPRGVLITGQDYQHALMKCCQKANGSGCKYRTAFDDLALGRFTRLPKICDLFLTTLYPQYFDRRRLITKYFVMSVYLTPDCKGRVPMHVEKSKFSEAGITRKNIP